MRPSIITGFVDVFPLHLLVVVGGVVRVVVGVVVDDGVVVAGVQTKTLARASAPAEAMKGLLGWKATSKMDSSNFLRCDVISWTHVLFSRFHSRMLQS